MFTPPPSPLPTPRIIITDESDSAREESNSARSSLSIPSSASPCNRDEKRMQAAQAAAAEAIIQRYERKKRMGRRARWAVLLVPAVLILVALTTRRLSMLDVWEDLELAMSSREVINSAGDELKPSAEVEVEERWQGELDQRHDWMYHHHKRQTTLSLSNPAAPSSSELITVVSSSFPSDTSALSASASVSASPTTTVPQTEQTIPPVPDSSNPPTLPTPFPQPFDTTGSVSNLTTQTCANFFTNMTQQLAFRSCRPFSLLEQFSNEFIESQTNLTLLVTLIYGTCNTTTDFDTCISNMDWFASSLSSSCSTELSRNNQMVRQTLLGLQSYALLRTGACLVNQQSNTYCYASAAHASSPADLYLYQLPLGIGFPASTTQPSCSTCSKSLLGLYADAVRNGNSSMGGLGETYESAANQAESVCGSGFAAVGVATSVSMAAPGRTAGVDGKGVWMVVMLGALAAALVCL